MNPFFFSKCCFSGRIQCSPNKDKVCSLQLWFCKKAQKTPFSGDQGEKTKILAFSPVSLSPTTLSPGYGEEDEVFMHQQQKKLGNSMEGDAETW